jgi:hypothetical protein
MVSLKFISPLLSRQKNLGKRFFQLSLKSRLLNVSCLIEMPSCEQLQNPFSSKIGQLTSTRCVCKVQHSHFWAQSRVFDVEKWASGQHHGLQLEISLSRVSFSYLLFVGPSTSVQLHTHHLQKCSNNCGDLWGSLQLVLGEKLGMGSTGLLYRGTYLGQDVAIKVMEIEDCHSSSSDSDAPSTTPSIERLQTFIQEVSIMRYYI